MDSLYYTLWSESEEQTANANLKEIMQDKPENSNDTESEVLSEHRKRFKAMDIRG